jgi:hypothetical protein
VDRTKLKYFFLRAGCRKLAFHSQNGALADQNHNASGNVVGSSDVADVETIQYLPSSRYIGHVNGLLDHIWYSVYEHAHSGIESKFYPHYPI